MFAVLQLFYNCASIVAQVAATGSSIVLQVRGTEGSSVYWPGARHVAHPFSQIVCL